MKVLSLNCQRGYQPGLKDFLQKILQSGGYDFLLLQEFAHEVPSYVKGVGPYESLQMHNDDVGEMSQTCIVYRKEYAILEKNFIPFAKMRRDPVEGFKHATFGSLFARFQTDCGFVLAGSVHLHSGMNRKVRAAQIRRIKEQALTLMQNGDKVIFGGDCNFGFPGERAHAEGLLAPQFVCTTRDNGPTLDGRYSENVPHLPNRIARLLGFFGIPSLLKTDQIFVDSKTSRESKITCRVLPDRVSDHNPVELFII